MPVTAKLSRLFYDRLGEQIANELVEWFNLVDTAYRSDLRELNELNFARFAAESRERWAEQRAWTELRLAEMEIKFEKCIAALDAKFERRFGEIDARVAQIDVRFAQVDARFDALEARMEMRFAQQEAKVSRLFTEQMRFLYLALVTQLVLVAGLYFR